MTRRPRSYVIHKVVGHLFPQTVGEKAENAKSTRPHLSLSGSGSRYDLGETHGNLPSVECDPATVGRVANSDHKDESGPEVDSQEAISQPRPDEHISGLDGAGELIYRASESDDAIMASKNTEPHDISGSTPPSPEERDSTTSPDAGFDTEFRGGLEGTAGAETAPAGVQPRGSTIVDVPSEDSRELSSVAASAEAEQKVEASDADSTAERGQNDLASPESGGDPAPLEDRDGTGREHGGADASDYPKQTAEGNSEVEHFEQGGEPQQTEQGASASEQFADAPTPAPTKPDSKKVRHFHPKVIVRERDYLSKSEEEILDRLIALKREQYGPQSSPTDEVEAGYSDLLTDHVSSTKTVQRSIPKLIDKGFIVRTKEGNEQKPGSRARYQIVPEQKVEDKRLKKGLTHFVEIGLARKAVPDPEQRTESGA